MRINVEAIAGNTKGLSCRHPNKTLLWDSISSLGHSGTYFCPDCNGVIKGPVSNYQKVRDFYQILEMPMTI